MAKNNSKKQNTKELTGKKSVSAKDNKNTFAKNVTKAKAKNKPSNLVLIITAAILSLVLIVGVGFGIYYAIEAEEQRKFNYLTSDLSKYITIDEKNYKNISLSIPVAAPKDIDVNVTILNLLASKKDGTPLNNGAVMKSGTISAGDVVKIYYRGYILDENGKEKYVANMCNFANVDPASLEIGSNQFIPGFELSLSGNFSGREFKENNEFVKIKEGKPTSGQIIYISYTKQLKDSTSSSDKTTATAERIILDTDDIDKKYGSGVKERILNLSIGADGTSFDAVIDGKTYSYTNFKIDFATTCESADNYLLVECYFPYDYSTTSLQNKTAYFEVYVNGMVDYEAPEFTDEFIQENLGKDDFGVKEEDLKKYEGTLTEKLEAYIKELLDNEYQSIYEEELEEAMWNHFHNENVTVIKRYPTLKVDAIYSEYFDDVYHQYNTSGGSIKNALGSSVTCKTVDEYAVIYLGLEYAENQDWKSVLYDMAKSLVKERLILYYLMREENIVPTDEALAEQVAASKEEYLNEYIDQYLTEYSDKKENYDEAAWDEFVAEREKDLYTYYNDDYFTETAYYEIALKEFFKWIKVTTMDDAEYATK